MKHRGQHTDDCAECQLYRGLTGEGDDPEMAGEVVDKVVEEHGEKGMPTIEQLVDASVNEETLAQMDDVTTAVNVALFTLPPVMALIVLRERTQAFANALALTPESFAEFMAQEGSPDVEDDRIEPLDDSDDGPEPGDDDAAVYPQPSGKPCPAQRMGGQPGNTCGRELDDNGDGVLSCGACGWHT